MDIIIIGGGPAGCAAAYTLTKKGHRVRLFEAADCVGGRTRQLRRDGFNLATGALFLMGGIYPRTTAMLREMGKLEKLVPWRGASQLMDSDNSRYPMNFVFLPSYLRVPRLRMLDRLRMAWTYLKLLVTPGADNPFDGGALAKYDTGENLEDWSRRNLGQSTYEYVVRPIMDFLYAVPASWLSTPFPQAIIKQSHKMKLSVPPGGVGQVSQWLVEHSNGLDLHLSSRVEAIEPVLGRYRVTANGQAYDADGLVLATESFVAAKLLGSMIPQSATTALMETPYTDYAHVAIGYHRNPWPDFPHDIVLPVGDGETRNIGALVLHGRRNPGSVPPGGEAVGVYFNTPPLAQMSDDDIRREAVAEAIRAFGPAPEPDFVHLFRYDRGLTIAKPGHYATLDAVHAALPRRVCLAGDYFSQAGVEAAVFSGELAAERIHGALSNEP